MYFVGDVQVIKAIPLSESYLLRNRDLIKVQITNPTIDNSTITKIETNSTTNNNTNFPYFTDYMISDSGSVKLPVIGEVYVMGLTIKQADSLISKKYLEYSSFYEISVRFSSFEIQALGEFKRPGRIMINHEYCTIYEAIGFAGDLTEFANKKNLKIIRTNSDGSKKLIQVDITGYDAFTYENYYVQPHDILYVAPQKAKVDKQNLAVMSIALGLLTTVYLLIQTVR
jgi:polysaccharide export outer membrane protein